MRLTLLLPLAAALIVSGCSDQEDDLRAWMTEASKDLKPNLKPLPPIQQMVPVSYEGVGDATDPFKAAKLEPDKKSGHVRARRQPAPRTPGRVSAAESLKMVGVLIKQGQSDAIIAADKTLHQVRVGNYLGQNYGQITGISETEITLKELVEDQSGEWAERISTLQLQEQAPQEAKK